MSFSRCFLTKLLNRAETRRDPKAVKAVKAETDALVESGTWLLDIVIEKDKLVEQSKASGQKIRMGDLMTICFTKCWERAK